MGGKLFAGRGLPTPRFSTETYHKATQKVIQQLQPLFEVVEAPICAPEKIDHGDIDLSTGGFVGASRPTRVQVETALGAIDFAESDKLWHYAVPWVDGDEHFYMQIDINVNDTIDEMKWELFRHNHGDFCAILGNMIRRHNLTISGDGFYLSLPELSAYQYAKKKSRVLLTSDPSQVLAFLTLDESRYRNQFDTIESMFQYITTCRFYRPYRQRVYSLDETLKAMKDENEVELVTRVDLEDAKHGTQEETLFSTSRDRKKAKQRPVFARLEDFLPGHVDDIPAGADAYLSNDELKEVVFSFFGEQVRSRYESVRATGLEEIGRTHFWAKLRPQIPAEGTELGDTIVSLRADVMGANDAADEYTEVRRRYRQGDFAFATRWCLDNWQGARDRYRERMARQRDATRGDDATKANSWSTKAAEVHSQEDDRTIVEMKERGRTWPEILVAIGKTSRSQLMAHWKQDLQGSSPVSEGTD